MPQEELIRGPRFPEWKKDSRGRTHIPCGSSVPCQSYRPDSP
ncbi:hypothetical protein HMPREF1326_03136 [Akkermansia sp. KLE1605]|nr:hypothetical protein HMPREF1326_03136 [Akkermansia sp. KLE1605]